MPPKILPHDISVSLHKMCNKYDGGFASMKQRRFIVAMLAKHAIRIDLDAAQRCRTYTVNDGATWAFTVFGRNALPHVTRVRLNDDAAATTGKAGPALSEHVRGELVSLLGWGPSEFAFVAPSLLTIDTLVDRAKMDREELLADRTRGTEEAWEAADLEHITRVQIAAKGILCEIGDNAGTSAVSMSASDAEYISKMLVEGHIRAPHWFQRKSMATKALRKACVVNKAKMPAATQALSQRMVDLMNDEVTRIGRPVGFGEYVDMMVAA